MRYRLWLVIIAALVLFALPSDLLAQTPTRTPVLLPSVTPSPTSTPIIATVLKAANLRAGPGTTFAIAGKAKAGDKINIVGANAASDWYQTDKGLWIAAFLVQPTTKTGTPVGTATVTRTVTATDTPIKVPTRSKSTPSPLPTVTPTPTEAPTAQTL